MSSRYPRHPRDSPTHLDGNVASRSPPPNKPKKDGPPRCVVQAAPPLGEKHPKTRATYNQQYNKGVKAPPPRQKAPSSTRCIPAPLATDYRPLVPVPLGLVSCVQHTVLSLRRFRCPLTSNIATSDFLSFSFFAMQRVCHVPCAIRP
jgi:hypothetical protein